MVNHMSHQDFVEKCNEAGEAKKTKAERYDQTAKSCGRVGDFSIKGLSFLASLLSDRATAAGAMNEKGQATEKSKVWSMEFLSEFNPAGHLALEDPVALRNFALQIIEGRDQYEPVTHVSKEAKRKDARIPSREILVNVIQNLRDKNFEVSIESIIEEVEEYYEDEDMILPNNWGKMTEINLRKWELV